MNTDSCFKYQIQLMKLITIWPLDTKSRILNFLHDLFRYLMMIILSLSSLCLLGATLFSDDLKEVSSTVDILTLTSSALYKLIFMTINIEKFQHLIHSMDNMFKPIIYNKNGHWLSIKHENTRCNFYSNALISGGIFTMCFFCIKPQLENQRFREIINGNHTSYQEMKNYPLQFWLPFNTDESPWYECVYTVQALSLFASAAVYLINDSFFFMIIYQLSVQMKMLSFIIRNLGRGANDYDDEKEFQYNRLQIFTILTDADRIPKMPIKNSRTVNEDKRLETHHLQMEIKLKKCILFHGYLLKIISEIEKINRSMILVDVLHAIISLSFALHETGISENFYEKITMYSFLTICIVHQFLNSHFGQMLLSSQEAVKEAIYMVEWQNQNIKFRKLVIMMQIRSLQYKILNGGQMYYLRRESFVLFVKTLFSYYMVLRQASN